MNTNSIRIKLCCEGCGEAYSEAKSIHPSDQNPEAWFCQKCATEQAQVHQFDPDARVVIQGRESMTNGEHAERGAITVCDFQLVIKHVRFADAGVYTVLVTNSSGSVLSEPAMLQVRVPSAGRFHPHRPFLP